MANALICERCEKTFPQGEYSRITIRGMWSSEVKIDLCSECKDKVDLFMYTNPKQRKKK